MVLTITTPTATSAVGELYLEALGVFAGSLLIAAAGLGWIGSRLTGEKARGVELVACCFLWFAISITLTVYMKWFFHVWGNGGFEFPFFTTMLQMPVKGLLSLMVVSCQKGEPEAPQRCSWGMFGIGLVTWLAKATPVGMCTSGDIALSIWSYRIVDLNFYTTVKTSSLVFTLLFSILMRLQPLSWQLILVVVLIVGGIVLASYGEGARFSEEGLAMVLGSSMLGGLRWTSSEILLKNIKDTSTIVGGFRTLTWITPAATAVIVPFYFIFEHKKLLASTWVEDFTSTGILLLLVVIGAFLACPLIVVELAVVQRSSALTYNIAGFLKELLTILFAVFAMGESFNWYNGLGFAVAILGSYFYVHIKLQGEKSAFRKLDAAPDEDPPQDEDDPPLFSVEMDPVIPSDSAEASI